MEFRKSTGAKIQFRRIWEFVKPAHGMFCWGQNAKGLSKHYVTSNLGTTIVFPNLQQDPLNGPLKLSNI